MSVSPDSTVYTTPGAPNARSRVMSPAFWAMMGVAVTCLLAAGVVVLGGPRVFGARPARPTPPTAAAVVNPTSGATTPVSVASPTLSTPAASGTAAGVEGRVLALEARQNRVLDAAAEALAVASLSQAASGPRPFIQTLTPFNRVLAGSQTAALSPLATQGAPTRGQLARQLDDIGTRLAVEARAPGREASLPARLAYALSRLVSVRRLDAHGTGPEALVAQAQIAADAGDIEMALGLVSRLPPTADQAVSAWREGARRRIAIDQTIAELQSQAISDLAAARRTDP